jgi:hypothetical protein
MNEIMIRSLHVTLLSTRGAIDDKTGENENIKMLINNDDRQLISAKGKNNMRQIVMRILGCCLLKDEDVDAMRSDRVLSSFSQLKTIKENILMF